jgi:hypothetical protein
LSGNFPTLSDPKEERKLKNKIEAYGCQYNRLVTFYHKDEAIVGISLQKKPILRKRKDI